MLSHVVVAFFFKHEHHDLELDLWWDSLIYTDEILKQTQTFYRILETNFMKEKNKCFVLLNLCFMKYCETFSKLFF